MNNKGIIGSVIFVGILLVVGFFWFAGGLGDEDAKDELCVPASCCHSDSCVWESEALDCDGSLCTLSCEPGTMDCGQGKCEIVDGKCEVVWNE